MKYAFVNGTVYIEQAPGLEVEIQGTPPGEETLEVIRELIRRKHGEEAVTTFNLLYHAAVIKKEVEEKEGRG